LGLLVGDAFLFRFFVETFLVRCAALDRIQQATNAKDTAIALRLLMLAGDLGPRKRAKALVELSAVETTTDAMRHYATANIDVALLGIAVLAQLA
jgi:hypothetical protein